MKQVVKNLKQEELANGEEEVMDGGGGGDVTPSTAERVRLWSEVERRGDSKPGAGEGDLAGVGEDEPENLERGGTRGSIAERRRLYENRSMSVQEPVSPSPTPLRRRDSLKQLAWKLKSDNNVNFQVALNQKPLRTGEMCFSSHIPIVNSRRYI
ncbi:Coronin-7 [Homalodisca vitripennis]|nr:Coronin-7 [Homalodisca vitripennis]